MLGFGGDRVGAKQKERGVEELYNATDTIDEAEITSVLSGSSRMQGRAEETNHVIRKNMVTLQFERRSGECSMSQKSRMRAESGTCNVCSAPCSSCMHLNLALMGSKTEEFSDETCHGTSGSQFSVYEGDALHSFKGRPHDSLQHTVSEATNMVSINSNHDSFSVNAGSKRTLRSSDISDASEEFEMHQKFSSSGAGAADRISPTASIGLDQRTSNKSKNSKGAEGHDDNISSVSKANDSNTAVSDTNKTVDIKNLSHSSGSICSLGPEDMVNAPSSQKLELSEIPLVEKVGGSRGSPKAGSPVSHSPNDMYLVEGTYEPLTKVYPKSEADTVKNSGEPPDAALQCLNKDKQELKSTQLTESPDVQPFLAASGDETDESEIMEQDVKVCDICGDAGREDLLAICSKCSDGAEHTYCMKEMLQKVPEGDWMCEECKFAEETEKQKQGVDFEWKRINKPSTSTQSFGKRHAENLDTAPSAKRQAVETSLGSPKPVSPGKTVALSRDSSFKSLDKGKVRPASFGNNSSDAVETARSPSSLIPQATKGSLLKSSSFNTLNSIAKVKLVDEIVPQKKKGSRDQASLDIKEGPGRVMNKSMSFRAPSSGRSSAVESKFRALSPRPSPVHDLKGSRQVKERNAFERKSLSRLDRSLTASSMSTSISTPKVDQKLTPRGESVSFLSASNNRESRIKSEGKSNTLSKSNSNKDHKGSEVSSTPVGALSTNVLCSSSVEQKLNLATPKEEPTSSSSWPAEKPSTKVNETESTSQSEKSSSCRSRPTLTASSKGVSCNKCKGVGHDVESCPLGNTQVSCNDVSTRRNSSGDMIKGNKLKAAIEAAMHKLPGTFGRSRVNDQLDGLGIVNMDLNCTRSSHDPSSFSDKMKGTHEVPINKETIAYKLKRSSVCLKLPAIPEHECIWQGGFEVHRGGKLQDLCGGIQAHLSSRASLKVLEMVNNLPVSIHLNEVPRVSTWPTMFHECGAKEDNIALYFFAKDYESYESSYKGLVNSMMKNDLALKGSLNGVELLIFPSNQLPESCQRWNMLFFLWAVFRVRKVSCSNSPNAGSNMVPLDRDIATDNISLSQKICFPKSSAACDAPLDIIPAPYGPDATCITMNAHSDNNLSSAQQTFLGSQYNSPQQDGRFDSTFSAKTILPLSAETRRSSASLEECNFAESGLSTKFKPSLQAFRTNFGSSKCRVTDINGDSSLGECSSSMKNFSDGNEVICDHVSVNDEKVSESMRCGRDKINLEEDLNKGSPDLEIAPDIMASARDQINLERDLNKVTVDSGEVPDIMESGRDQIDLERDLNERIADAEDVPDMKRDGDQINLERDLADERHVNRDTSLERHLSFEGVNHQQSNYRSAPQLFKETAAASSCGTSQKLLWNEAIIDGVSISKKLKKGSAGAYECSSSRDGDTFSDGFSSRRDDLCPSSSNQAKSSEEFLDRKVIKDLGSSERYFFPVNSFCVNDFRLGSNSIPWKEHLTEDGDQLLDGVPNLDLALGAETKQPNKGILPFFVDKNCNPDKPPDPVAEKGGEEDVSAALSLSLSFPFPVKEQTAVNPANKAEQLLPERHQVNSSLLLFGGYLDK